MTYPDGNTFAYGYDAAGRLASIAPGEVLADSFTATNGTLPDTTRWTTGLTANGTASVQGNELALSWATAGSSAAKITSKAPATVDQNVSLRYRFANTTSPGTLTVQTRSSTAGNYRLVIASNTATATVFKQVGTTSTALGTFTVPISTAAQRLRFQVQGTAVKARTWANGTAEPTVWGASFTDTAVTAAGVTFMAASRTAAGTNSVLVDDYSENNPTTPPTAAAAYGYNLDDQLTLETLVGGTRTRTYANGRLTTFNQNLPGAVLATSRTFDTTGRIGTETTGTVTTTFGYDAASQLTAITPSTGSATVYTYDKLGRRATSKVGTAAAQTYTYDSGSQLTAIGTNTFTYDAAGRRLTDTTTATNKATYTYDLAGRLATIARVNGTTTTTQTRTYNPTGLLASVSNLTGTTTTTTGIDWDTTQGVAQPVDFVSAGLTDLVNGPGGWLATRQGATSTAIAQDIYGSTVPSTGVAVARDAAYSPFGVAAGTNTFEPKLGYRGEISLDSLTYLRARNYDTTRGQFLSVDPAIGRPGTATMNNPYHYADNRPIDRIDPLGLFAMGDTSLQVLPQAADGERDSQSGLNPMDRTTQHNILVAIEVAYCLAAGETCQANFRVVGGSKKNNGNDGFADIVHNTVAGPIEVAEVKAYSQMAKALPEATAYAKLLKNGTVASTADATVWSVAGTYSAGGQGYSYTAIPGGFMYLPASRIPAPRTVPIPVPVPVPAPLPQPVPVPVAVPDLKPVVVGAGGAIAVWWALKVVSPACGPFAPICVIVI